MPYSDQNATISILKFIPYNKACNYKRIDKQLDNKFIKRSEKCQRSVVILPVVGKQCC